MIRLLLGKKRRGPQVGLVSSAEGKFRVMSGQCLDRDALRETAVRPHPVPATQHGRDGRYKQRAHDKRVDQDTHHNRKAQLGDLHHRVTRETCETGGHHKPTGRHYSTRERNRRGDPFALPQLLYLFADTCNGQDVEVLT